MSQHDYNIANQSGAAFRADLNNALSAILTQNSGNSAPTTTSAYMVWVDTSGTPAVLKIRNAANSAWITLARLDLEWGYAATFSGTAAPTTPYAYQFWIDTSGGSPILKIRNAANSAWISLGVVDAANFALLPIAGGTLTGFLSSSNTDYWKVPAGTTGQRPGSPVAGMIRYNSDLATFEGYSGSLWGAIGGGGGGAAVNWLEQDLAPLYVMENELDVFSFEDALDQYLYAYVKVPASYKTGSQVKLLAQFYSAGTSGTILMQTRATLIRNGVDAVTSTTNQRTSTNSAVTLSAGTANEPQLVEFDLTSTSGQINSVAIAANDVIKVRLTRNTSTDTATASAQFMPTTSEATFS